MEAWKKGESMSISGYDAALQPDGDAKESCFDGGIITDRKGDG